MAKLSPQDILKLARLSRLRLTEEEIEQFGKELSDILDYVEKLRGVNTGELKPTAQVTGLTNVMRQDKVVDYQAKPDDLLKNAPAVEKHQIKVKRVID